jgi:hypothetical protein
MRTRRRRPRTADHEIRPSVQRRVNVAPVTATAPVTGAVARGLDPGELGAADRGLALGELGASAGNAAVVSLVHQVRTNHEMSPEKGVIEMRQIKPGNTLGHTRMELPATPPLFEPVVAGGEKGMFTARPRPVRIPEPTFDVRYPGAGMHLLPPRGGDADPGPKRYLDVASQWPAKILSGEDEHVEDQTLAIDMTWGRVRDVINELAEEPPATGPTAAAAEAAAWKRFADALPKLLRPAGERPSKEAQQERWGPHVRRNPFDRLLRESEQRRDLNSNREGTRNTGAWHSLAQVRAFERKGEVYEIHQGDAKIPGPLPDQVMKEAEERIERGG